MIYTIKVCIKCSHILFRYGGVLELYLWSTLSRGALVLISV